MLTGHRQVSARCKSAMKELIESFGEVMVISGGNMGTRVAPTGADRLWALSAYELGVPYEIYVPLGYGQHYYGRRPEMKAAFDRMLLSAHTVQYVPNVLPFNVSHNFQRNIAMVETANIWVVCGNIHPAQLRRLSKGGTVHCVKSMYSHGINEVHWIESTEGKYQGLVPLAA